MASETQNTFYEETFKNINGKYSQEPLPLNEDWTINTDWKGNEVKEKKEDTQDDSRSSMKFSPLMVAIAGLVIAHTNPTPLNAQDCSKITSFTKKLACKRANTTKDLSNAQKESKRLDKKIITSTKRVNSAINKLTVAKKSYTKTKDNYKTIIADLNKMNKEIEELGVELMRWVETDMANFHKSMWR